MKIKKFNELNKINENYENHDDHDGGCFNESADEVKRIDMEDIDIYGLDSKFTENDTFKRLKCQNCGGLSFEVIYTGDYETSAKCDNCKMYYVVHEG